MTHVAVFRTRFSEAWGKLVDGEPDVTVTPGMEQGALPVMEIGEALRTRFDDYAHIAAYYALDEDFENPEPVCYRLSKSVLQLDGFADAIRMGVALIDLDRDPHVEWDPNTDDALITFTALRELFPKAAVFTTRRGCRLVFKLPHETDPHGWEARVANITAQVGEILNAAKLGVQVDDTTAEWTRLFQLPNVIRDGSPTWEQHYFHIHIPEPWVPTGWGANPSGGTVVPSGGYEPKESHGAAPEPRIIEEADWNALERDVAEHLARDANIKGLIGKLRRGEPFFEPGHRNSTTFRMVAAFLEAYYSAREQDPTAEVVYSYFHASTKATKGNTPAAEALSELWSMVSRMVEARSWATDKTHAPLPQKDVSTKYG
jgi:hypothetical protein